MCFVTEDRNCIIGRGIGNERGSAASVGSAGSKGLVRRIKNRSAAKYK